MVQDMLLTRRKIANEIGLLRHKSNMVLGTILLSKVHQPSQFDDTVGEEDCIVSLANAGYSGSFTVNTQLRQLSCAQLVVVAKFVQFIAIYTPLLQTKQIVNRPHQHFIPFGKSVSGGEAEIYIQKALVGGAS